ncbi:hypothetical protein EDB85DRAFT_2180064 [Lactarius pseudohatsudake]|nr:hypothetical protein EDB85DRAFT_2180064 [Lactarius pseudohatsudake]
MNYRWNCLSKVVLLLGYPATAVFENEIQYGIGAEFEAFILLRKKSHKSHHFSMSSIGELWGRNVGYGIVTFPPDKSFPQNPCSGDAIELFVSWFVSVFKASRGSSILSHVMGTEDQRAVLGIMHRTARAHICWENPSRRHLTAKARNWLSVSDLSHGIGSSLYKAALLYKDCRWDKRGCKGQGVSNNDLIANLYYLNCARDNVWAWCRGIQARWGPRTAAHDLHFDMYTDKFGCTWYPMRAKDVKQAHTKREKNMNQNTSILNDTPSGETSAWTSA